MILSACTFVDGIRENSCRIPKTFRAASPEPGLTACRPFTDRRSQYEFIAGELLQMTPGQRGRTGIIFRTHAAAAGFTPFLAEKKIPFLSNGKGPVIKSFSERIRILRDLTAYYRSAVKIKREGAERKDLLRIMNCPERFLSGSFILSDRPDRDSLLANAGYERAAILDLLDDLDALNTLTPAFSFRYLMLTDNPTTRRSWRAQPSAVSTVRGFTSSRPSETAFW